MSLKSFFGIKDINQKVSEWVVLDLQFDDLNKSLDILSDDYFAKKQSIDLILKSEDVDPQIIETVENKWGIFFTDYVKELGVYKKSIDKLKKSQGKLENDSPIFKGLVDDYKKKNAYEIIKKAYKSGELSQSHFDNILKAANKGPVKYSDVIVHVSSSEGGESYYNKILILERRSMESTFPNQYVVPGGHVDYGESFEEAAKRELFEETGIQCTEKENFRKIGKYKTDKVHIEYFDLDIHLNDHQIILDDKEHSGYFLLTQDELFDDEKYVMPMNMKENLKKVLNRYTLKDSVTVIKKAVDDGLLSRDVLLTVGRKLLEKAKKEKSEDKKTGEVTLNDIAEKHGVSFEEIEKQHNKGIEVEKEHSDSDVGCSAGKIAKDHLMEDPKYYDKLKKIEKALTDDQKIEVDEFLKSVDGEMTNEILGGFVKEKDLDINSVHQYFLSIVND